MRYGANDVLLEKESYLLTKSDILDIQDIHYHGDYVIVSGKTRQYLTEKEIFKIGNREKYSEYVNNGYRKNVRYSIINARFEKELIYIFKILDLLSYIYTDHETEIALFKDIKIIGKKEPKSLIKLFLVEENEEKEVTITDIYNFYLENIDKKEKVEETDFFIK